MFKNLLIESPNGAGPRRTGITFLISLTIHLLLIGATIVIPMWIIHAIPQPSFLGFLASPPVLPIPAPPTPPPSGKSASAPRSSAVVVMPRPRFAAPAEVPTQIAPPTDEPPVLEGLLSETGHDSPGFGKGPLGGGIGFSGLGVSGSGPILTQPPKSEPPPPKPRARPKPYLVGGQVMQSKLVRRVDPTYPPLAKRTGVSGTVILQVTVSEMGQVEDVQIVRGHPLLTEAAVAAVRQWVYSPTLLNGEPVPVTATVTVNFTLR